MLRINFRSFLLLMILFCSLKVHAYSVLTHQALIDASWDAYLKPLLKSKYPSSTEEQLREAHAYAYGGAITPDMGYYPFGSELFTNLTHYVRSGDFINALFAEAKNLNGYAYALGNLCHYYADIYGHPIGTNRSVPLIYPKVGRKYGKTVTYAQHNISHMRTEFGFDVLQSARGNFSSKQYRDFIGFKVDTSVLKRAFYKTYGLRIDDVFRNFPRAVSSFRWSVAHFLPAITRTAWATRQADIKKLDSTATSKTFGYRMKRRNYKKEFGKEDEKPALGTTMFSLFVRILPKVGPLRVLKFKVPNLEAEKLFIQSFDTVLLQYNTSLKQLQDGKINLPNHDYDTGEKTRQCAYILADETYYKLLMELREKNYASMNKSLKDNLLRYYGDSKRLPASGKHVKKIKSALVEVERG